MPHIRDPVTHRCVVCQVGRHPSPFPIGWRSGGLPHKCHQWERFELRRRANARERYRRQVERTSYTSGPVREFGTPEIVYTAIDYDESFVPQEAPPQASDNGQRRPGGLLQPERGGTASLDQYHFFNDPLVGGRRGRRQQPQQLQPVENSNGTIFYLVPGDGDSQQQQQQPPVSNNKSVAFTEPPAIEVVDAGGDTNNSSGDKGANDAGGGGLRTSYSRRQTRGAFSQEEFRSATNSGADDSSGRQQSSRPSHQQASNSAPADEDIDEAENKSSTCAIL